MKTNQPNYPPPYAASAPMEMNTGSTNHSDRNPIILSPPTTSTTVHVNANIGQRIRPGKCPVCQGDFTSSYPCCAWLCCIFCFPCGIICCCCMKKKKCSKCGMMVN